MKLILFILSMAFLFALLDWEVVKYTRITHPELTDWMHGRERVYAAYTRTAELILCAPALAFKPIFYHALMVMDSTPRERERITHAPAPDWAGFYALFDRSAGWEFMPWWKWFLYWIPWSAVWWILGKWIFKVF